MRQVDDHLLFRPSQCIYLTVKGSNLTNGLIVSCWVYHSALRPQPTSYLSSPYRSSFPVFSLYSIFRPRREAALPACIVCLDTSAPSPVAWQ
ncbi:hypothetical protein VTK73DRAFT_9367 [Phialemonium thermophilum]|uniref:Uncharacterized protein n=1 Tax=Phialemonium thermophilum TaxID=223376 RepID=A0ABR3W2T9_9PEZI